jgi:hypothetical protein
MNKVKVNNIRMPKAQLVNWLISTWHSCKSHVKAGWASHSFHVYSFYSLIPSTHFIHLFLLGSPNPFPYKSLCVISSDTKTNKFLIKINEKSKQLRTNGLTRNNQELLKNNRRERELSCLKLIWYEEFNS